MKKIICLLLGLMLTVSLTGCENNNAPNQQNISRNNVSSVVQQQINQNKTEQNKHTQMTTKTEPHIDNTTSVSSVNVDVDLTKLSSTMVYSEVYNMMNSPEDYIGKIIKMNGQFAIYQATDTSGQPIPDQIYFACVIADATACCKQGLEFVLNGDYKYPVDYPQLGTEITVVGEFKTYIEGTTQYCNLINAQLTV